MTPADIRTMVAVGALIALWLLYLAACFGVLPKDRDNYHNKQ